MESGLKGGKMGIITTKKHALTNYTLGLILTFSPWIFGFSRGGAATCIPFILGLTVILYTLLSDHEYGSESGLKVKIYCFIDTVVGLFIGSSPWLFGFADYTYAVHLLSGLSLSLNGILTAPLELNKLPMKVKALKDVTIEKNKQAVISATEILLNTNKKAA